MKTRKALPTFESFSVNEGLLVDQANKNQQELSKQKQLLANRIKDILKPIIVLNDQVDFAKEVEAIESKIKSMLKKFIGEDADILDSKNKPVNLESMNFTLVKISKNSSTPVANIEFGLHIKNVDGLKSREKILDEIRNLSSDKLRVSVMVFPEYFENGKISTGSIEVDRWVNGGKFYDKAIEEKVAKIIEVV